MRQLDRRQAVRFVQIQSSQVIEDLTDKYEYRPTRRFPWLQRVCFWLLDKLGAHSEHTYETFTRVHAENDKVLHSLFGQQSAWYQYVWDHADEGFEIIMGPNDCAELLAMSEFNGMRPYTLDAGIEIGNGHQHRWNSIPITVIPWMDGAVLVPKKREVRPVRL